MYEHIHIQREKTSLISKIQFIRQASYGMGYLHSREIVHKRLTTRNIFLCPNVRISAVDYGLAEVKYDRWIKSAHSWIYKTNIFNFFFSIDRLWTLNFWTRLLLSVELNWFIWFNEWSLFNPAHDDFTLMKTSVDISGFITWNKITSVQVFIYYIEFCFEFQSSKNISLVSFGLNVLE